MKPDISIVIPTGGRPDFLPASVASALSQEGVSVEVIVVHDGPCSGPLELGAAAHDPRVRVTAAPQRSDGRSGFVRNTGAPLATGRYLHFLDDDDLLLPGALASLAGALDANPGTAMAYGVIVPFGGTRAELAEEEGYWLRARRAALVTRSRLSLTAQLLFRSAPLACSACLIRREAFEALGGFDESMRAFVDGDLYLRAIRRQGAAFVDRHVVRRRIGHPAVSRGPATAERYRLAYRQSHAKYRRAHGRLEYLFLHVLAKTLGWRAADPCAQPEDPALAPPRGV